MNYLLVSVLLGGSVILNCQAIENGDPAFDFQFPWHVYLTTTKPYTGTFGAYCGGSLISNKFVLTSAVGIYNSTRIEVSMGSINRNNPIETQISFKYFVHPDYILLVENDIAIVELPNEVTFRNNLRPLSLPSFYQKDDLFENAESYLSGFGVKTTYNNLSPVLEYAHQRVISNQLCDEIRTIAGGFRGSIKSTNICAESNTDLLKPPQGICMADEGGALATWLNGKWIQIGIAGLYNSRNNENCRATFPQVYTRITQYLEWVSNITGIEV